MSKTVSQSFGGVVAFHPNNYGRRSSGRLRKQSTAKADEHRVGACSLQQFGRQLLQ